MYTELTLRTLLTPEEELAATQRSAGQIAAIPDPERKRRAEHRQKILRLAVRQRELQTELAANRAELHQAIRESVATQAARHRRSGVSDLARITGMTRTAIYKIIGHNGVAKPGQIGNIT